MKYWIIKAQRHRWTMEPSGGKNDTWDCHRTPREWKTGDMLFVWGMPAPRRVIRVATLLKSDVAGGDPSRKHFEVRYETDRVEGPTLKELRGRSIFSDATFLKQGPGGTVFPLTAAQGKFLASRLGISRTRPVDKRGHDGVKESPSRDHGAGFGDAEKNALVEREAINKVRRHYERHGWRVRSVERDRRGFDLLCTRPGKSLHVEVKGVSSTKPQFSMTAAELKNTVHQKNFVLAVVTTALTRPRITLLTGTELGRRLEVTPSVYRAKILP